LGTNKVCAGAREALSIAYIGMQKTLEFESGKFLETLFGGTPENLTLLSAAFSVKLTARDHKLILEGPAASVEKTERMMQLLEQGKGQGMSFKTGDLEKVVALATAGEWPALEELFAAPAVIALKNGSWIAKTLNQKRYILAIRNKEIVFGIGPAGTGKTYLAVATALEALQKGLVKKIILTRPAVEAGEALGFLPGELEEKILPYLRPLYDAMDEMVGKETVEHFIQKGVIEIAPLAYMRGRTLSDAFIVLDEAQNTTQEQMMMFLTRLGSKSRMVITGDITQIDLPRSKTSGLKQAIEVLTAVEGVELFYFDGADVVRHPLVQRIIEAYDRFRQAHLAR
jgi:phosphate starvation-inducible protein PhoH and related proteins